MRHTAHSIVWTEAKAAFLDGGPLVYYQTARLLLLPDGADALAQVMDCDDWQLGLLARAYQSE